MYTSLLETEEGAEKVKPLNFSATNNMDHSGGTSLPFTEHGKCATWELGSSRSEISFGPTQSKDVSLFHRMGGVLYWVKRGTQQQDIHTKGNIKSKENS